MINICDQLKVTFSIGPNNDFINPSDLISFTIYTKAGNIRPIIHLSFILTNRSIINYLNQGNILSVSFGIDDLTQDTVQFQIFSDNIKNENELGYQVNLKGALYIPEFTSKLKSVSYNLSAFEVIKKIAEQDAKFNFVTNITQTNDRQQWFQCGETDWQFLNEVWLHSYINEKTFTVFGFDCDSFYFYDMAKLVKAGAKYIFSPKGQGGNFINTDGYHTKSFAGVLSPFIGKNLISKTYNIDNNKMEYNSYSLKNFTIMESDKLNLNNENCLDYYYNFVSNDMHSNYIKAYNQNVRNNIMYSSFATYLSTALNFPPVKLLDPVAVETLDNDTRVTGLHFVTAIAYQFSDQRLVTNFTLNKEAPSCIKGDKLIEKE